MLPIFFFRPSCKSCHGRCIIYKFFTVDHSDSREEERRKISKEFENHLKTGRRCVVPHGYFEKVGRNTRYYCLVYERLKGRPFLVSVVDQ